MHLRRMSSGMNRKQRRAAKRASSPQPSAGSAAVQQRMMEGIQLHQAGRLQEAEAVYAEVRRAAPGNPDVLHLLGVIAHQTGKDEQAVDLIGQAIKLHPTAAMYRNNMGASLRALGRYADAAAQYREALKLEPGYTEARVNLGNALADDGDSAGAIDAYRQALVSDARNGEAHAGLGSQFALMGKPEDAERHFREALKLDPQSPGAHRNLASLLATTDRHDDAIALLQSASRLEPGNIETAVALAGVLRDAGRPAEAETLLNQILSSVPGHAPSLHLMGMALKDQGNPAGAEELLLKAAALTPTAAVYADLGNVQQQLGNFDRALASFDTAANTDPEFMPGRINSALLRLAMGDLEGGWREYRHRPSITGLRDKLSPGDLPIDLSGRRVLLLQDQGLGDEIFFLRFALSLKDQGAWLAYKADPKIESLVARLDWLDRVYADQNDPADIHLTYSVGDLPDLLGATDLKDVPAPLPLTALPARVTEIDARLTDAGPPPYIAITWRAGIQQRNRLSKIAPVEAITDALSPVAGTVIAVQRAPEDGELATVSSALGRPVADFTDLNADLEAMLALMDRVDDYIGVSNTNTHLRTSLGHACRVLVPHPADYRWMLDGPESPWFPGCPIYRETPQGWEAAAESLAADILAVYGAQGA